MKVVITYKMETGPWFWLSSEVGSTDRRDATIFSSENAALTEWMRIRGKLGAENALEVVFEKVR